MRVFLSDYECGQSGASPRSSMKLSQRPLLLRKGQMEATVIPHRRAMELSSLMAECESHSTPRTRFSSLPNTPSSTADLLLYSPNVGGSVDILCQNARKP
ncbi:hypothetical protein HAX54_025803 [Datura stramonium]|uniref:Uncharacterized protein n=1 Tax=Datura stramonium TaxID=4076 RepID=A0ABS8V064_DATST|nr:hypothetical protein [Datura stramonium]